MVGTSFRRKLDEWKPIPPNDEIGLRKIANFLVQCETAMNRVSGLGVLDNVQENQKMLSKLPKWLTTRWARVVYKSREEKQEFPTFSEFVKFLVTESNIMCDPTDLRSSKSNDENKRAREPRKDDPRFPKY